MLRNFRQKLDASGIYVRRSRNFEGLDPYLDLTKLLRPGAGDVAIDVGSNCGQTVAAIKRVFPDLPIQGFEPVQASLDTARKNCSAWSDVALHHLAVGGAPATVTIYSEGTSQLASLRDTAPRAGQTANTVNVVRLDEFLNTPSGGSVVLLKSDTEGFDLDVLRGSEGLFRERRVMSVLCEVGFSSHDASHSFFPPILSLLEAQGFVLAALYDQPGFWHLRDWGSTFANALFVRRDLVSAPRSR